MIDRGHDLSIVRQAKVLKLARSTVYYEPRPVSAEDLALMRRLDELHLDYPFAGARMLRSLLRREGVYAGRRHIATLMKRMRIEAVYRRPNTSKPAPGHKIYPYLLRGLKIERPDHAWAMDITYIPMRRGFVYLAAVVDVFSRRVLAHRVSITMEAAFCVEAVQEALAKHGRPAIFNTDQGSQFTSLEFTDVLLDAKIAISMDGKGAWRDNVFVERLWRTVKYEEVYLRNGRMTVADDFVVALVGLRPSRRNDKIVKPRVQHNPAGIHLNPAGRCPNNRGQLSSNTGLVPGIRAE
ncbi:putative transposase [Bradyrhizobium sp. USDA 377]